MNNEFKDGFSDELSNEEYHAMGEYLSNSSLKAFANDKNAIEWASLAEQDYSKMDALNFGTWFHTLFLETDDFIGRYIEEPKVNLRTNAGKDKIKRFKEICASYKIEPIPSDDMHKLKMMYQSAMSHPTISELISMSGIVSERSYFWKDESGVMCKCRPDAFVKVTDDNRPDFLKNRLNIKNLVIDLKTIARMDRVQSQIAELKYHYQDEFYSRGIKFVESGDTAFIFIFVSTSIGLGRYPVLVTELDDVAKLAACDDVTELLHEYKEFTENPTNTVGTMKLPNWAIPLDDMEIM